MDNLVGLPLASGSQRFIRLVDRWGSSVFTDMVSDGPMSHGKIRVLAGLDDGVTALFQRSRIHKPHAHTQAFKEAGNSQRSEKKAAGLEDDNDMQVDNEEGGGEAESNSKGDMSCGDEGDDDYKLIYDGGGGLAAGFGERNGGKDEESRFSGIKGKTRLNARWCINDGSRPALDANLEVSTGLDNMEVGYTKEFNSVGPTDKYIGRGYKGLNKKYVVNKNKQQNIQEGTKIDTEKNEKLAQDSPMGRRDKRVISSPGSTGSAGVRLRKKRKASGKDKKKIGRRSITKSMEVARKTGIKGLGENKKRVLDEYKVYLEVSSKNKGIFHFRSGKEDDANSVRCNVNMEQVKKIREMIGVSWVHAEEEVKDKNCNC
ncbi:hypothetical protein Tco_0833967 [Tanacetum coccineum]